MWTLRNTFKRAVLLCCWSVGQFNSASMWSTLCVFRCDSWFCSPLLDLLNLVYVLLVVWGRPHTLQAYFTMSHCCCRPPEHNPFYTSIDSMPEIKPRRKSIPLVSDLVSKTITFTFFLFFFFVMLQHLCWMSVCPVWIKTAVSLLKKLLQNLSL